MTQQHPTIIPPELVRKWMEHMEYDEDTWFYESYIAEQAAQWGADQELEACCQWISDDAEALRIYRRPKPPIGGSTMTQDYKHPITPPLELVEQWSATEDYSIAPAWMLNDLATRAALWGADQELEACCAYMQHEDFHGFATELRAARRPKPPSPKLQALKAISHLLDGAGRSADNANAAATIRRALEALPE